MAYTKTEWVDGSSPALDSTNLNNIEKGIEDAHTGIDEVLADIESLESSLEDAQNNLNSHIADTIKHITSAERTAWNGKANASHTHTKSQITDFPASMPASDVYSWAKQSTKPSYTASEVGAASSNHTHTPSSLGAAVTMTYTLSVPNTGWVLNESENNYYQYIDCQGLLESDTPILDVVMSSYDIDASKEYAKAWGYILRAISYGDKICLITDGTLPSVSFQIKVKVVR